VVPKKKIIRIRSVWLISVFCALALLCQRPIEASDSNPAANYQTLQPAAGEDSLRTQQQFPMGKMSRRAKVAQRRISVLPTETTVIDTSQSILEAIRALPRDSSARIAQFKYVRKDKPAIDGQYHRDHPLFLAAPPVVKRQALLDSTKWVYRLRQTIGEYDTRVPTEVPFDEYTSLRLKQAVRQNWESIAQFYQLQGDGKTTLGDLFGKITKIEVPVPKNPLFSIFGPNIIRLNINGAIDIAAGFKNTKSDLFTSSVEGQSQSVPSFKQEIQVNVKGEIGDKLTIDADWNTQRTFEYENQLHVKYQGYDDEIVQSVEAGNVSLPTSSSFISGGSALFGIMAKFQIGPLRLTTVMTQKKGQTQELSISGGGQSNAVEIRPANYSRSHFFVDTSYIGFYDALFQTSARNIVMGSDTWKKRIGEGDIEVWISTKTEMDPSKFRNVIALMDEATVERLTAKAAEKPAVVDSLRKGVITPVQGQNEEGKFIKLVYPDDYEYDDYAGTISLRSQPDDDQVVAVYYHLNNSGRTIGQSSLTAKTSDSLNLLLKLVRPKGLRPELQPAWKMMLKNRYSLGGSGIDKSSFVFNIDYQLSGQPAVQEVTPENIGILEMLGLDRITGDDIIKPDKVFDYDPGVTINEKRGEIIFPTVEPFDTLSLFNFFSDRLKNTAYAGNAKAYADSFAYGAIYDKTLNDAVNDPHNLYYMRGTVKAAQSNMYRLGGFNVVEGSVVVTVDGVTATPGVDYTVDYISSQVVIKNTAYLTPGRNVQIKYESNDMFQLASKSLVGARGEFDIGKNTTLGFTIMNYNEQSLSDKVRLGEEPISNTIMGVDGGTTINARWLTDALNFIPGMKATVPSQITLHGEVAYMLPNPNTRTSSIPTDGTKGVAYIDDFEGARQTIPLGASYAAWKDASAPWYIENLDTLKPVIVDGHDYIPISADVKADNEKINYKARASWFNVIPSDVNIPTIWGDRKSYASGEGQVTALDFYFRPAERGQFNCSINLDSTIDLNNTNVDLRRQAWAGIQHVLSTTSTNLVEQNVGFIELWINIVEHQDSLAKLNIDLGYLSEDVIPDKKFQTEDGLSNPPLHTHTGIITSKDDFGLDTMSNAMEKIRYKDFVDTLKQRLNIDYGSDPSGDDWAPLPAGTGRPLDMAIAEKYSKVNGTEGNYASAEGRFPDTEDLNRNDKVDLVNKYFEYEIPLHTGCERFKQLKTGFGDNGWYQIRIPLADYTRKIGDATLTSIEGVRLWLTGAGQPVLFRIVDFNLVGNQWEKRVKTDTSFEISVVNAEDNPSYNTASIGVQRQKVLTSTDPNLLGNEQSLNIIVKNLGDGRYKEAVKNMKERPIDMFNYRTLKMFIHGETGDGDKHYNRFNYNSDTSYDAEVFLHFGDDTSNYYEYRAPVHPDWTGNDIVIKFADLTSVKALDTTAHVKRIMSVPNGPPGATYYVRGNPRLDKIQFISIGIENPSGKGDTTITGELWANELRLTDVDDTPGWAYKVDASIKLSDVGSIAFSLTQRDPFFHGLEQRFGSRNLSRAWSISSSFAFDRLLPESWNGTVLGVNYSHSESMNKPRYIPGTDILVENAAARSTNPDSVRLRSEELKVSDSYSIPTLKLNIPAKTWFVTETINKMTFGYTYTQSRQRSPSIEYAESWNWSARFDYGTQFNKNNFMSLGALKIFYTPKDIRFGATLNRSQTQSKARTLTAVNSMSHDLSAQRSLDFNWQFFEGGLFDFGMAYNVNISSSLYHINAKKNGQLRPLISILSDIFFSDRIANFGIDKDYRQSIAFNTKLAAPELLKMDKIFTPNFQYSVGYNWTNNTAAGPIGRSAAWNGNPKFSLDVNLKPITDAIWSSTATPMPADTGKKKRSVSVLKQLDNITRALFKYPFFDFEKFSFSFTQTNSSQNNGVRGSNGFANIFARVPIVQSSLPENGPSLFYQLGLTSDPNGYLVMKTKGSFPFITGYTVPGIRANNANIIDAYSQSNQISLRTSRPLWEGVTLSLDWRVGWAYNENRNSTTDDHGRVIKSSVSSTVSGSVDRSFNALPPVLFFKLFNTSIENVNEKYESMKQDPNDTRTPTAKLSQAFEQGMEALPWLTKIFGSLAPRANWSLQWDGLEKFSLFKSFASRVSLTHAYSSTYKERWRMSQGEQVTESQTVAYGFAPLAGVNVTFKGMGKGNLSAAFRYGASTSYDLSPSAYSATEISSSEISITGNYSRQGFELPLFGVSLMNNIDIAFTYSYKHNALLLFDFKDFKKDGIPQDGTSRTSIEPRIGYTLSERVRASFYYRYTKLTPDAGGSRIPGSTINEGGLDVHVDIK
jgi:cell surface protein SprA